MPCCTLADTKRFAKAVWRTIESETGLGAGGILTYQDFGERAFAKRHPHIDMTLNGWTLKDGRPEPTPEIELEHGGYDRIQQELAAQAGKWFGDTNAGNLKVGHEAESRNEYWRTLAYQLRELFDVRKIHYDRETRFVAWENYHAPPDEWERFTVHEFKAGVGSYQWRLKQWPGGNRKGGELHNGHGHMAKSSIGKAARLFGSEPRFHDEDCVCMKCVDWERVPSETFAVPTERLETA